MKFPTVNQTTNRTMKYETLDSQLQGRNRLKRKLGNNTYAQRDERDGSIAIWLHSTPILTFNPAGEVIAKTGGWKTVTTKARLNEFLPHGFRISQARGVWYWYQGAEWNSPRVVFSDGDSISSDGKLSTQAKPAEEKRQLAFRRQVNKFAALCESKLPLPMPSAGDCFYCQMTVSEGSDKGKSLGDASKDFSHLKLHMDEGYVVPSMVLAALKEAGCGDLILAATFGQAGTLRFAGYVKRAVAKYLLKRKAMFGQ